MLFLIIKIVRHVKFNIKFFDSLGKENKALLGTNIIIGIIVTFMQGYLIVFFNKVCSNGVKDDKSSLVN